jgi:hypothetical protein
LILDVQPSFFSAHICLNNSTTLRTKITMHKKIKMNSIGIINNRITLALPQFK